MSWDTNNLPEAVKNKNWSKHQKEVFMGAANSALKKYKDDSKAIAIGIHAADNLENELSEVVAEFKKIAFIEPGLTNYKDIGKGTYLFEKNTLDNMVETFKGKPVIIGKHLRDEDVNKEKVHGYVTNVLYNEKDGQYYAEFILTTEEGKQAARDLKYGSWAGNTDFAGRSGTKHSIPYDDEVIGGEFTHLLLTNKPRYEDARILNNSVKENCMSENEKTSIVETITQLFNSHFPSKTEAKDDYVVKVGDQEFTVADAKTLLNALAEKKAKKAKKKAKKEAALKNKKDGDADKPKDEELENCSSGKDKKKALKNALEVADDKKLDELYNNIVLNKYSDKQLETTQALFNELQNSRNTKTKEKPEVYNVYRTEKQSVKLAEQLGI